LTRATPVLGRPRIYTAEMPRELEIERFMDSPGDLLKSVVEGGEPVFLTRSGYAVAVLAQADSAVSELPRWESWLQQLRGSFVAGSAAPEGAPPARRSVEKSELGFDPGSGQVGTEAGRALLIQELSGLGVPVGDPALLDRIYSAVLSLCEDKEKIYATDLRVVAQEIVAEAPQHLRLLALTVTASTGLPATAEVTVDSERGPAMCREQGDGPLDAAIKAVQRLSGIDAEVENFSIISATQGRDAIAEAVIELRLGNRLVMGSGASPNAVEAGVHAYLNALNFLLQTGPAGA